MKVVNYAHRGCSEFFPENTLFSFYMGLDTGADGIETDVQGTSDGVLVLFHDDDMSRIIGSPTRICDHTYAQLLQMDFGSYKGPRFKGERIVRLDEFLLHFGAKDLTFALEVKQIGVEKALLDMIGRYGVRDKVIITSFYWQSILSLRKLDDSIRLGYLTEKVDEAILKDLLDNHIQQICPRIDDFDELMFDRCTSLGLSIRYWGISDTPRMLKALKLGGDGMTMNNPGKLQRELNK